MREVLKGQKLNTPSSVKFLYYSKAGGVFLKIVTCRFVSKVAGAFLSSFLSRPLIKRYIKKHRVDMGLYLDEKYKCFNDFFTRRIRPELRPFALKKEEFPSPCDAKLSIYTISPESEFNIKGFTYTAQSLLKDKNLAKKYNGGTCVVLRLSVEDYHRYFYVDSGEKEENIFIKGKLHTVQPAALERRRVFSENCREYTVIHTENFGDVVQMEVGAMMVGRIVNYDGAGSISRGAEKGKFQFGGSTIVLFTEKDRVVFDEEFYKNTSDGNETIVKCGEKIGRKQN